MDHETTHPPLPSADRVMPTDGPLVWSFIGDSVTAASWHTWGRRGYAELFHERLRELGRTRDGVVNTAVSGLRIGDIAADLDTLCLRFRPEVVVIGTGLNDTRGGVEGLSEFTDTYRSVVERIRTQSGALVVAQTPNGTLPTGPPHVLDHLETYVVAIRELAAGLGVELVDHARVWAATDENSTFHWLGHGCHPNAYGHRAMARTLMQAFGVWDPAASRTCRLTIP